MIVREGLEGREGRSCFVHGEKGGENTSRNAVVDSKLTPPPAKSVIRRQYSAVSPCCAATCRAVLCVVRCGAVCTPCCAVLCRAVYYCTAYCHLPETLSDLLTSCVAFNNDPCCMSRSFRVATLRTPGTAWLHFVSTVCGAHQPEHPYHAVPLNFDVERRNETREKGEERARLSARCYMYTIWVVVIRVSSRYSYRLLDAAVKWCRWFNSEQSDSH